MLIRPKTTPIDPANPFAHDKLERYESATLLTQLVERVDSPLVLSIDARWGDGKTTFVRMWQHFLATHGIRSLYFNAWDSDYSSDPLISFIGEMGTQLADGKEMKKSTRLRKAWKSVKEAGALLLKRAIPVGFKVSTAGLLELDDFTEQSWAEMVADLAKEKIDNYEADKSTVGEFKARLQEFVHELSSQVKLGNRPVVFFVDELDRCRPTFAIELLERIKHFFDVEGLMFVLSLDKEQLGHSIRAVYGSGIDVDGYLRRFIDVEYRLPRSKGGNFVAFLAEPYQIRETLRRIGQTGEIQSLDVSLKMFEYLADIFGLSLRKQEQTFAMVIVALLTASRPEPHLSLLMTLAIMKAGDREWFDQFVTSKVTVKEVIHRIQSSSSGKKFLAEDVGALFEAAIMASKVDDDSTVQELETYYRNILTVDQGRHVEVPRARRILELFNIYHGAGRVAASFIRALEISGRFRDMPTGPS